MNYERRSRVARYLFDLDLLHVKGNNPATANAFDFEYVHNVRHPKSFSACSFSLSTKTEFARPLHPANRLDALPEQWKSNEYGRSVSLDLDLYSICAAHDAQKC
jgi:hypothetical protein